VRGRSRRISPRETTLRGSWRCSDVTAHAVCPSYVRTPLVERQIAAQAAAYGIDAEAVVGDVMLESNAVKRMIEPEEVADAVAYLCRPWRVDDDRQRPDARRRPARALDARGLSNGGVRLQPDPGLRLAQSEIQDGLKLKA
jgi:NAD(P)-dependent dehydrogenase (short-subunit alcohol dehydrogenase family)